MERRPKVNQGQNRNREIWLSGIVGGLVETCCNGLITICHEVGNDGYSGSYWPKTGVRHISISTAKERILLANSSLWGELTKNRREFGQNWGQDAVQSAESHGLWGENR
jgi:hypothetical protein